MPTVVSDRPQPYQSRHNPLLHSGQVSFTGSTTVDLGLGHNNFQVEPKLVGGLTEQNIAPQLSWDYGDDPGTFVITAGKFTASGDNTIIAATAECTVSFIAVAGASVE